MKKRTVITNRPIGLPINSTILYTFLLYYFKVDGLYWGIFITVFAILWIVAILLKSTEVKIDLDDEKTFSPAKTNFQKRLEDIVKQRNTSKY